MEGEGTDPRADIERRVRERMEAADPAAAVAIAVDELGDEVYAYVLSRSRDEDEAADVFGQACADLVKSMPTFQFRCSVRTWFYRLARSAGARHRASPANQRDRRLALSQISEAVDHVRTRTKLHMRSEVKDGFRKLREQLDPDDQQLLQLRIDRDLGWNDIAEIVDDIEDPDQIARAAARLRQQFQKLKDRLRELAVAEGLIPAS
jgi:RNA polymerase sigma-70 factor (ECF subfamily)